LDDEIHEVDFIQSNLKPTTTVLNYLRSLPGHKGVKEGCAEGDCGACTVVLASLNNRGQLEYRSIDSCLVFLPMVHGKQIITVENLAQKVEGKTFLHPVQQAMVENDGSQCGYCTPGIVMSLFALYKNHEQADKETIGDALTGNLCRCTGYRSIIDAGHQIFKDKTPDQFNEQEEQTIELLRQINADTRPVEIATSEQHYLKPFTLTDALRLRQQYPEATIASGSTDLALLQTKKRMELPSILDISSVADLDFIVEDHRQLAIGAGTTLEELHQYTKDRFPYLYDMLHVFGALQIRNRATLGGNIASASPIGDMLPVLLVLKAKVRLMKATGQRDLDLQDFIVGYRNTALAKDELLSMIIFKKPLQSELIKNYKISKRKDLDISSVSACYRIKLDEEQRIVNVAIAYGGVAAVPIRAHKTEQFLSGKQWDRSNAEMAAAIVRDEFKPLSDARSSAEARRLMASNLILKYWDETKAEIHKHKTA
jgi:xanthine dehydrogenase small subunit